MSDFICSTHGASLGDCPTCKATKRKAEAYNHQLPPDFRVRDGQLQRKKNGAFIRTNDVMRIVGKYIAIMRQRGMALPEWW